MGYGREFIAAEPTHIGVLPVGYAHGYPVQASKKGEVLHQGKRYQIAGRVCMDSMMVDFKTAVPHTGEEIVLLGSSGEDRITAEEFASWVGTIPYEIVTRLDSGVPRIYL